MKIFSIFLIIILSFTNTCESSIISGKYTLSNGKTVNLQGLEWLPLYYTAGISRDDIENGFTDRFENKWQHNEWRYATREETEKLIGSLWDNQYDGWSTGNAIGAWWFLDNFGGLSYDSGYGSSRVNGEDSGLWYSGFDQSFFYFGETYDCSSDSEMTCVGHIAANRNYGFDLYAHHVDSGFRLNSYAKNSGFAGYIDSNKGLNTGKENKNNFHEKSFISYDQGSLLVRKIPNHPNEVPTPSIFIIFITSICFLLYRTTSNTK